MFRTILNHARLNCVDSRSSISRWAIILLLCVSGPVNAKPVITPEKAVQIAIDFCKHVGAPVTGTPSVSLKGWQYEVWKRPYWQIEFLHQASVHVLVRTGNVSDYHRTDHSSFGRFPPLDHPLTEQEAVAKVTGFLKSLRLSHCPGELAASTRFYKYGPPAGYWWVRWSREVFPLGRLQTVGAIIEKSSGVTDSFEDDFAGLTVKKPEMNIGAPAALRLAWRNLTGSRFATNDKLAGYIRALIVSVNRPRPKKPGGTDPVLDFHSAWTIEVVTPLDDFDVWIDTATGKLLDNDSLLLGNTYGLVDWMPRSLQNSQEAKIYKRGSHLDWIKTPALNLSETSNREAFHALKLSLHFNFAEHPQIPQYEIVLNSNPSVTMFLFPELGVFGRPGYWFAADLQFMEWFDKAMGTK